MFWFASVQSVLSRLYSQEAPPRQLYIVEQSKKIRKLRQSSEEENQSWEELIKRAEQSQTLLHFNLYVYTAVYA